METIYQLKDILIEQGIIDSPQWDKCVYLQERCKKFGILLPLSQIIIELNDSSTEYRQRFLDILLRELEPFVFILKVDPLCISLGADWFLIEKAIETGAIDKNKLRLCNEIVKDLESEGIVLTLAEIFALKGFIPEHIIHESTTFPTPIPHLSAEERKDLVSLDSLCKRMRGGDILPPMLTIDQLSGSVIPRNIVKEGLSLKEKIKSTWGIELTIAQILAKKYLIDLSLLHLLFLSQAIITKNEVSLFLGKIPVDEFTLSHHDIEDLQSGREEARQFLAWTYRMSWLNFTADEENRLFPEFEKRVGSKKFDKIIKLQKLLEKDGLRISILKILAMKGIKNDTLLEVVSAELGLTKKSIKKDKEVPDGPAPRPKISPPPKIEDTELSKILLKQGLIKEEELSSTLLALEDLKTKGEATNLGEALVQRGLLKRNELYDLINKVSALPDDNGFNQEKRPSKLDLKLADLVTEYNILPSVDVQRSLHLQAQLCQSGISKPLEEIMIQCRFLSPGMARDLISECRRRHKKSLEAKITESQPKSKRLVTQAFEIQIREALTPPKTKEENWLNYIQIQGHRSSKKRRTTIITKKHVFSSIGALAAFLIVVILILGSLKTHISGAGKQADSEMPGISPSENRTQKSAPPTNSSQTKTYEEEMKKRGYVPWGSRWVSPQEKKILENINSSLKGEKVRLTLSQDDTYTLYTSQGTIFKIDVRGRFLCSASDFPGFLDINLYLTGPTDRNHFYIKKRGVVKKDGSFEETLSPLPRPLLPGRYGVILTILPSHQDPIVRDLIKWSKDDSWSILLKVGNDNEIEERAKNDSQIMADLLRKLKDQKKPREDPSKITLQWLSEWLKDIKKVENEFKSRGERALIPLFPKTEAGLLLILNQCIGWGERMELWLNRRSLFPPASVFDESFALSIDQVETDFEREKNLLKQ